jgi:hypothetical protein
MGKGFFGKSGEQENISSLSGAADSVAETINYSAQELLVHWRCMRRQAPITSQKEKVEHPQQENLSSSILRPKIKAT